MKLYFFPAFLPLAEALPWLLTAFGAFAGLVLGSAAKKRSRNLVWGARALCVVLLIAGGWFGWPKFYWWLHKGESRLTPTAGLPVLVMFSGPMPVSMSARTPYVAKKWNQAWTAKPKTRALSSPVEAGGLFLVGTWEGTVEATSLQSGAPLWKLQKKEPVFALTVASPELLLVGEGLHTSPASSLTAIRLPAGAPLWQREFQGHIESAPTYSAEKNKIWLGTGPSGLWCLDAGNGSVVWNAAVGHVDSTPLLAGGMLYFASQPDEAKGESIFWAVDAESGKVAWQLPLPGMPWGSPRLDKSSGLILTSTGIGQIGVSDPHDRGWAHGISANEKRLLWTTPLPGNPIEASVQVDDLVIFELTKGELHALHAKDGKTAWQLSLDSPVQADLAIETISATVAATGADGLITLVDARTGKERDRRRFDAGTNSAPLFLPDGMLIATPYAYWRFRW